MGRAPCCDKENVKRGPWSPEEDAKLKGFIEKYGTGGNWIALPQKAGLKRCGKSCRLRWLNYLRPNIKHGEFTDDEDKIICSLYANIGSRWSIIAAQLPGRTDNDIKNYWNTKLKKKLLAMLPSFQKRPYFPLQSPPITYGSDLFLTYDPSSPNFNNPHTTSNIMNLNSNNTINSSTTLVQDHMINITHHLSSAPPPPPNSNSLISVITNNNIHNNEISPCYLGFQGDHQQSMYSNTTPLMEYQYYPASDVKEAMLMFGSSVGEGHEVSTTGSSSEGGSCLSQMSYGNYSINKDHGLQKQHDQQYQQIKQEDQFSLQGSGDQTQRFIIDHNYTDQRPKGYNSLKNYEISNLHSDVDEEVKKQQLIGTCTNSSSNSTYLFNDNDEYKTTQDHKDICYHY